MALIPAANADWMEKICSEGYCSRVQSPKGNRGADQAQSLNETIFQQMMKIR